MNKFHLTLILVAIFTVNNYAQEIKTDSIIAIKDSINPKIQATFESGKSYELGGISVKGLQKFEEQTVKVYSGLKVGQQIKLPGDKLTSAIKKLYGTKQFSDV